MNKFVLVLSFMGTALLFSFGLFSPESPIMWLASTSHGFAILRLFLLVVLAGLILTEPPRNKVFRVVVGLVSLTMIGWAIGATYENTMKFMDSLVLLEVGIATAVAVLERKQQIEPSFVAEPRTKKHAKQLQFVASH